MTTLRAAASALVVALALGLVTSAAGPRFYADDPLVREPESRDASKAAPTDVGLLYEISYNLFVTQSRKPTNTRAKNVNTVDEIPDSGWFTNRILPRAVSAGDLVRGANAGGPPNPDRWVISREKSA